MSTESHWRKTAAAALRALSEGRLWYQQQRFGGLLDEYLRIIRELAEDVRSGWLDEPPPRGEVYVGVDYGTAGSTATVTYVAEGGRVWVVPEGWPWTPEMSEEVRRNMRQVRALYPELPVTLLNQRPEELWPETVPLPSPGRPPSRQPPPSRREWWR